MSETSSGGRRTLVIGQPVNGCRLCELLATPPPEGWLHVEAHWSSRMMPGWEIPGWVGLCLRRHGEGIASLTDEEAASFGPLVVRVTRAIRAALAVDRVYLMSFNEVVPHVHTLIAARSEAVQPENRGAKIVGLRDELVAADEAASAIRRIRSQLEGAEHAAAE